MAWSSPLPFTAASYEGERHRVSRALPSSLPGAVLIFVKRALLLAEIQDDADREPEIVLSPVEMVCANVSVAAIPFRASVVHCFAIALSIRSLTNRSLVRILVMSRPG